MHTGSSRHKWCLDLGHLSHKVPAAQIRLGLGSCSPAHQGVLGWDEAAAQVAPRDIPLAGKAFPQEDTQTPEQGTERGCAPLAPPCPGGHPRGWLRGQAHRWGHPDGPSCLGNCVPWGGGRHDDDTFKSPQPFPGSSHHAHHQLCPELKHLLKSHPSSSGNNRRWILPPPRQ